MKKIFIFAFSIILSIGIAFAGYNIYMKNAYPLKYKDIVKNSSEKYNVDQNLIFAIIKVESDFKENALSKAGAIGLMQIMPSTFKWLQTKRNFLDSQDLSSPEVNIDYGTYFLSYLLLKYKDSKAAIAAYNAGPGNVDKWLENKQNLSIDDIEYQETKNYVNQVIKVSEIYKKLYFK